MENNNTIQQESAKTKKNKSKNRFCKKCGSLIENKTKKCTSCGKQYFKFKISIFLCVILVIFLFISAVFNVLQYINYNVHVSNLKIELSQSKQAYDNLNSEYYSLKKEISQKDEETNDLKSEPEDTSEPNYINPNDPYSFDSVSNLLSAIKANPTDYNGKQIKINGTLCKMIGSDSSDTIALINSSVIIPGEEGCTSSNSALTLKDLETYSALERNTNINIKIPNDIQYTVLTSGDLVEVVGAVTISNGEIYLDNCDCTIITPYNER